MTIIVDDTGSDRPFRRPMRRMADAWGVVMARLEQTRPPASAKADTPRDWFCEALAGRGHPYLGG